MEEDPQQINRETADALKRALRMRDWDGIAAVIAAFVGLLALCVSGYTAWLQRQQVRAQVWPYLETSISATKLKIMLTNKGVGPALVRDVHVYVDNKPQHDWPQVIHSLGLNFNRTVPYSTITGIVLSAGDHVDQLVLHDVDEFNEYRNAAGRASEEICYCSTMDECWIRDDRESDPARVVRYVGTCPAPDGNEFIDNVIIEPASPAEEKP